MAVRKSPQIVRSKSSASALRKKPVLDVTTPVELPDEPIRETVLGDVKVETRTEAKADEAVEGQRETLSDAHQYALVDGEELVRIDEAMAAVIDPTVQPVGSEEGDDRIGMGLLFFGGVSLIALNKHERKDGPREEDNTPAPPAATLAAVDDVALVREGAMVQGSVQTNDSGDGELVYTLKHEAPAGLSFNADGSFEFDASDAAYVSLPEGEVLTLTVVYVVRDASGVSVEATLTITVTGSNSGPVVDAVPQEAVDGLPLADAYITEPVDGSEGPFEVGGQLIATDPDLGGTVTWSGAGEGVYGSFSIDAQGNWVYTLDESRANALQQGQVEVESFEFTVTDDQGESVTQTVSVVVLGTNDAVLLAADRSSVDAAAEALNASEQLIAPVTGSVMGTERDVGDVITATAAMGTVSLNGQVLTAGFPAALGLASAFALTVDQPVDSTDFEVNYTWSPAAVALDFLAAGEELVVTYTITVSDGLSTKTHDVSFVITGTQDLPVVKSVINGQVVEDAAELTLSTDVSVAFRDADLSDVFDFTATPATGNRLGGALTLKSFDDSASGADGSVTYTYALPNEAAQYLGVGESASESFTIEASDGQGGIASTVVTVVVVGRNDGVSIVSANTTASGDVTEDGESLMASGTVVFNDVDLTDVHQASFQPAAEQTALGTFALGDVVEAADTAVGTVGWSYTLNNEAAQYLAADESVSESFTVTVTDASGASAVQVVTLTIQGTNDGVTLLLDESTVSGRVTEDAEGEREVVVALMAYDESAGEPSLEPVPEEEGEHDVTTTGLASQTATGTIAFNDVDLTDTHTAAFEAAAEQTALGTFALGDVVEAADTAAGTVGWTYTLNNAAAQYLAADESVSESYTVTITDEAGATATQTVTVTIQGTNDGVSIVSDDSTVSGRVTEDADSEREVIASPMPFLVLPVAFPGDEGGSGAGVMERPSQTATGTIAFSDVDLTDTHTAAFEAAAEQTTLGTFALGEVMEEDDTANGTVGWTYTLNNAAAQYLAADESVSESYTVTITDEAGATATQTVTVTIQGTNDGVSIVSDDSTVSGRVTEDADSEREVIASPMPFSMPFLVLPVAFPGDEGGSGAGVMERPSQTATGTIAFSDVDLTDTHTAAFEAAAEQTTLGTFALGEVMEEDDTANGTVGWTYTLNNAAAQYLAADESVSESYTVTITDEAGATATQTVTVTIQGTNDGVTIVAADTTGTVVEDARATPSPTDRGVATGTIAFNDVDLTDTHTAAFEAASGQTTLGTFSLSAVSELATTEGGTVGWTYTLNNAAAQYLAADESVSESFTVTITDEAGATATQVVTVTIQGTNDGVIIVSNGTTATGTVVEDAASTASETDCGVATGAIAFNDVDLTDTHTAAFEAAAGQTTLGTFALGAVSESATTEGGSVGWTYTLNNAAAQYLAADESVSESFTVTITDEAGVTARKVVTITIQGTNDAPTIMASATTATGSVTEDGIVSDHDEDHGDDHEEGHDDDSHHGHEREPSGLSAAGTIAFNDVDLTDTHTVTFTSAEEQTALGTFALGTVSESATTEGGTVGWTYTLDNAAAQSLAAGQTVTEVFVVTVRDEAGATVTQNVSITIAGTNDEPTLSTSATGYDKTGAVSELANNAPGEGTTLLSDSGKIVFADVDTLDTHTVSTRAGGSGYYGSFNATLDQATKAVNWTFSVSDGAIDGLSAGQTVIQSYTVTIKDPSGEDVTETVRITITGAADNTAPSVAVWTPSPANGGDSAPGNFGSFSATDVDGDDVSLSITEIKTGSSTITSASEIAKILNMNVNGHVTKGSKFDADASYTFKVSADDGQGGVTVGSYFLHVSGEEENDTVVTPAGVAQAAIYLRGDNDMASGSSGNDSIFGQDGNDRLNGLAGDDQLVGGDGRDVIRGGLGKDTIDLGRNDNDVDVAVLVGSIDQAHATQYASAFNASAASVVVSKSGVGTFDLSGAVTRAELVQVRAESDHVTGEAYQNVGSEDVLVIFGDVGNIGNLGFSKMIVNSKVTFDYADLLAQPDLKVTGGEVNGVQTQTTVTVQGVFADEHNRVDLSPWFGQGVEHVVIEARDGGINADTVFVTAAGFQGGLTVGQADAGAALIQSLLSDESAPAGLSVEHDDGVIVVAGHEPEPAHAAVEAIFPVLAPASEGLDLSAYLQQQHAA